MKTVELLTNTAYKGPRQQGDVISVPDDFANRWCKNGIAKMVEEESAVSEAVDYSSMNAKELYAACKEKGIEVEAKKSKEYYIEKLTSH